MSVTDHTLTDRQQQVLDTIETLTATHGYPPTLQEIATALGLKNRMNIKHHVVNLKELGRLTWNEKKNRTLRVISEYERTLATCAECAAMPGKLLHRAHMPRPNTMGALAGISNE